MFSIGIDIGGTWVRIAAVAEGADGGQIISRQRMPLAAGGATPVEFVDRVAEGVAAVVTAARDARRAGIAAALVAIGVAVPGLIDAEGGAVVRSVNVPFLEGVPFRRMIEDRLRAPVLLTTDAQACCWAEFLATSPRPSCFVHLRLGTGVACAVASDGQVKLLDREGAKHPRLLVVESGAAAKLCKCGLRGCLETVASGGAILEAVRELGVPVGMDAAHFDDARLERIIERAADATLAAIRALCAHFQPDVVCLGGGLLEHCVPLRGRIEAGFSECGPQRAGLPRLTWAQLGDDAGVIGAAGFAAIPHSGHTPEVLPIRL